MQTLITVVHHPVYYINLPLLYKIVSCGIVFTFVICVINVLSRIRKKCFLFYICDIRTCKGVYRFTCIATVFFRILIKTVVINYIIY